MLEVSTALTNAASSKNAASVSANCGVEIDTHYHAAPPHNPPVSPNYRWVHPRIRFRFYDSGSDKDFIDDDEDSGSEIPDTPDYDDKYGRDDSASERSDEDDDDEDDLGAPQSGCIF